MKNISHVLTIAALSLFASGANAEAPFSFAATPGKLPKNIVPADYKIQVIPDLAALTFKGSESIEIDVKQATSTITLNALNLEIDTASLSGSAMAEQSLSPQFDKAQQTVSFALAKPLTAGSYTLRMSYRGVINRQPDGLYYDKYPTPSGDKYVLGTQMEPTEARRFFPCWDEPVFRARFTLSVDVPNNFKAYSNTPAKQQEKLSDSLQRISFGTTPKMSSYLVVLVAGELERNASTQDGTEIGVVTTQGKQASTPYALASSKDILHYYNTYFGLPYPLPKLDNIAMPGGFGGAMENWGGIVYNESRLLFDPIKSPEAIKQTVFSITAHEMAHQWFGDLVTMAWWDNLWLNEGFASWMATKTSDHFHPDWTVWLRSNGARERAMNMDARKSTHPIQQTVANESEANDAFDDITYLKGQGFLRMLETYLGEQPFRKGIQAYLAKHQYSSTTTADLWASLEKSSGKPVGKIASDWTTQPGFPVVKVDAKCLDGKRKITLHQEQFQLDDATTTNRLWNIPVSIGTVGGKADYVLLSNATTTITRADCSGTLLLDPDSVGFYRVQYSDALLDALQNRFTQLPDNARLKILSDTWAMVSANRLPLSRYMVLLKQLGNEPRLAVWDKILSDLRTLDNLSAGDAVQTPFHQFAIDLLLPKFQQLGWIEKPEEPAENRLLRTQLIFSLAVYEEKSIVTEGRAKFRQWLDTPQSLPTSLLEPVLFIAGRHADQADYDALKSRAEKAQTSEEKFRIYRALSTALDPKLAQQTLKLALATDLPPLVTVRIVQDVAANEHLDLAWKFAQENGDALLKSKTIMQRNLYFPGVLGLSTSLAQADELEAYVKAHLPVEAMTEAKRGADAIRLRVKTKGRLVPEMESALKK